MNCPFEQQLGAYHDGELAAARRVEVEAHLAGCEACAEELRQLRTVTRALQAEFVGGPLRPMLKARVRQRIEAAAREVVLFRWASALTGAAAAVLVVGLMGWYQRPALTPAAWEQAAVTLELDDRAGEVELALAVDWPAGGSAEDDR